MQERMAQYSKRRFDSHSTHRPRTSSRRKQTNPLLRTRVHASARGGARKSREQREKATPFLFLRLRCEPRTHVLTHANTRTRGHWWYCEGLIVNWVHQPGIAPAENETKTGHGYLRAIHHMR